jgi:hydroxymethylbilane synthase
MRLRLGTRQSQLAMWQANWTADRIRALGIEVDIVPITTAGDVSTMPLGQSGGVGLFTKEIQRALLDNRCDLAVHSLKDLPTEITPGLKLSAVPEREDVRDCLISRDGIQFADLPHGATIGTGSPRRVAQLKLLRPDIQTADIRGNLDTRIKKLDEGQYDAIMLAAAGLRRLKLDHRVTQWFDPKELLPAVGQAALGIETRDDDQNAISAVNQLNHLDTKAAVLAERNLLRHLRGGCLAPVAALARVTGQKLVIAARVLAADGSRYVSTTAEGSADQPEQLGTIAAELLRLAGATELIQRARS